MPPRRLHLPRLSRSRFSHAGLGNLLILGTLIATTLVAGFMIRQPGPPASERQQRAALAMVLYGQDDPDAVVARGLHGLGALPVPVSIEQLGPCRFILAAGEQRETIDFSLISDIRHTLVANPAAGLVRTIGHLGRGSVPQMPLTILSGSEDAICTAQGCTNRRVFALSDPDRIASARAAVARFRSFCPGPDEPPGPS